MKVKYSIWIFGLSAMMCIKSHGQFQVNNSATDLGGGNYSLTPALNSQFGSIWYKIQHNLNQSLNVQGRMYFGTDDAGADGIAFVMQDNCLAAGTSGGGIGYEAMPGKSIAVEFDTYQNISGTGDFNNDDPAFDHIAVEKSGSVKHDDPVNNLVYPVQMHATKANVEDGIWYDFRISYNAATKNLSVYFDNTLRVSYNYDILANVFGGAPYVYWGFTSSTGGFFNDQRIYIDGNLTTFTLKDTTVCNNSVKYTLPPLDNYDGTNIALNKASVVSSNEGGGPLVGTGAFDGNMGTRWSSAFADPQWVYVDLASVYDIDSVVLYWEGAYGSQYKIQTSSDASVWTDRYTETAGDGGKDKIVFSAPNARYVRMYGTQRATVYGYSLWEFRVYGKAKYVWTPGDGSIDDPYSNSPTMSPAATTTYHVTLPDPCSGTVSYDVKVTVSCPLPVELVRFNAITDNEGNVSIDWTTAKEKNTSHFVITRSVDGVNFTPIGIVNASGNTNAMKSYSFNDHLYAGGVVYYQLITKDTDGSGSYSAVKAVTTENSGFMLLNTVFENETTLYTPTDATWVKITVVDVQGRNMLETYTDNVKTGEIVFGKELPPTKLFYLVLAQSDLDTKVFKVIKRQ